MLNEQSRRLASGSAETSVSISDASLTIQALTLFGWMHDKQNLGVTEITIDRNGGLKLSDRQTICDPVFSVVPQFWY